MLITDYPIFELPFYPPMKNPTATLLCYFIASCCEANLIQEFHESLQCFKGDMQ